LSSITVIHGASYVRFPTQASAIYPYTDAPDGTYTGFFYLQKLDFLSTPPKLRRKVYRFVPYMNRSRADVHVDVGACRNPTLDGELPHKAWRYAAY
jgi:hypothetical protein